MSKKETNKKLSDVVKGVPEFKRIEILEPLPEMNEYGEGIRLQLKPEAKDFEWMRREEPELMTALLQNLNVVFDKLSTAEEIKTNMYIRFASMPFENYFKITKQEEDEQEKTE